MCTVPPPPLDKLRSDFRGVCPICPSRPRTTCSPCHYYYPPDLVICVRAPERREEEARDKRKKPETASVSVVYTYSYASCCCRDPLLFSFPRLFTGLFFFLISPPEDLTPHPPTPNLASSSSRWGNRQPSTSNLASLFLNHAHAWPAVSDPPEKRQASAAGLVRRHVIAQRLLEP